MTGPTPTRTAASTVKPADRKRSQAERTALSDRRMVRVALAIISTRGTHALTLKEVGERAGYSRGLASYRFGTKEDLFSALVDAFDLRWVSELSRAVGDRRGLDALDAAIRFVADFTLSNPRYVRSMFVLYYETIGGSADMRARLARQQAASRRDMKGWIVEAIDAGTVRADCNAEGIARGYQSVFFGLIYQWLADASTVSPGAALLEYHAETVRRMVTSAVAP